MAKKKKSAKGGANKSQAVRDQMAKHPNASANEIAELASKQIGQDVAPGLVYNIKSNSGASKNRRKKKAAKATAAATAPATGGLNAALIKEAAAFLSHAGDAKAARAALDVASDVGKIFAK